jgi:hypothetical protein
MRRILPTPWVRWTLALALALVVGYALGEHQGAMALDERLGTLTFQNATLAGQVTALSAAQDPGGFEAMEAAYIQPVDTLQAAGDNETCLSPSVTHSSSTGSPARS